MVGSRAIVHAILTALAVISGAVVDSKAVCVVSIDVGISGLSCACEVGVDFERTRAERPGTAL